MKIALVANRDHPQVRKIIKEIKNMGHKPAIIHPHQIFVDYNNLNMDYDLYAVKVNSYSSLHSIMIAEENGIPTVNKCDAIRISQDKIFCDILLRKHNIPIPHTYFTEHIDSVKGLRKKLKFPMVVKPYNGSKNIVYKVKDFDELINFNFDKLLYFQNFIPNDGYDRKIYCVGDEVFGVKRISPLIKTFENKADEERTPMEINKEIVDLTLKVGEIFGLEIFGIDILPYKGSYVVLDVNDFPGFRGVKEAGKAIARYLISAAKK